MHHLGLCFLADCSITGILRHGTFHMTAGTTLSTWKSRAVDLKGGTNSGKIAPTKEVELGLISPCVLMDLVQSC